MFETALIVTAILAKTLKDEDNARACRKVHVVLAKFCIWIFIVLLVLFVLGSPVA